MEAEKGLQDPFETLLSLSEQLLARDPDDARVLAGRAMSLHMLERYPEALAAYDRVLELQADDPVMHFARADILSKLRRHSEAVPAAEAAIRLGGERPEFLLARAEASMMELTADETGLSTVGRHPFADRVADS